LPLYILIALLPAWLRSEGVDLKVIGLFALATVLPWDEDAAGLLFRN
jgi:hypothetical protein